MDIEKYKNNFCKRKMYKNIKKRLQNTKKEIP